MIVADPEKFVPKPKQPPRPFTDPQAEADSEVFIPYLSDLEHFFELYNGLEDVAEMYEDGIEGFEDQFREEGRELVPEMMRDGMEEETARRILKKAFALRFRVAHPEFKL